MITNKNALPTCKVEQGAYLASQRLHDTSTKAQRERLLKSLIEHGSVNTMYARDRLNIMAPAARVKELRHQGIKIHTDLIVISDRDGRLHRKVARYVLVQLVEVSQ